MKPNLVNVLAVFAVISILAISLYYMSGGSLSVVGSDCQEVLVVNNGITYQNFDDLRQAFSITLTDKELIDGGYRETSDGVTVVVCVTG